MTNHFVTIDDVDVKTLSMQQIQTFSSPIQYQRIPIKYQYDVETEGPLLLRTPKMQFRGVHFQKLWR
ncbi:hypothetical protein DPMN_080178 [Dreissena polymorpha]|uniref:Uncharacterized protein n=1 Tax=Dreissena polymorpha TaxID=45954 RepID=A0A9D3YTE6_DREPO|nr:hypothetical protein DPMN_080178 [Dreissena polymorpha]